MSWLRYEKRTELPDGSVEIEEGNTLLGNFVEWVGLLFYLLYALCFWLMMPLLIPFYWLADKEFRTSHRRIEGVPPGDWSDPDAPWNREGDDEARR